MPRTQNPPKQPKQAQRTPQPPPQQQPQQQAASSGKGHDAKSGAVAAPGALGSRPDASAENGDKPVMQTPANGATSAAASSSSASGEQQKSGMADTAPPATASRTAVASAEVQSATPVSAVKGSEKSALPPAAASLSKPAGGATPQAIPTAKASAGKLPSEKTPSTLEQASPASPAPQPLQSPSPSVRSGDANGKAGDSGTPARSQLPSGLVVEDIVVGSGKMAGHGKTLHVFYRGTLKNGTVFDDNHGKAPFRFVLGKVCAHFPAAASVWRAAETLTGRTDRRCAERSYQRLGRRPARLVRKLLAHHATGTLTGLATQACGLAASAGSLCHRRLATAQRARARYHPTRSSSSK